MLLIIVVAKLESSFNAVANAFNVLNVAAARVDLLNFGGIHIDTEDFDPRLGKLQRERQADIAQTDNGDFHA